MRQCICVVSILIMSFGMFFSLGGAKEAAAQVRVDVNIGPPPPYVMAAPPAMVVIPGTYVYAVADPNADILFYNGFWFRPHEGHWFRARSYNGPWAHLAPRQVPQVLIQLPPDYRRIPSGYHRIPYGEFNRNWGTWQRKRYWDRDREWQAGWHGRPEGRGVEERGRDHGGR